MWPLGYFYNIGSKKHSLSELEGMLDAYPSPIFSLKCVLCYFPLRYVYCAAVQVLNVGKVTGINRIPYQQGNVFLGLWEVRGLILQGPVTVTRMEIYCSPRCLGKQKGERDCGD